MQAGQKLNDPSGKQVALFPLPGFGITQADTESYSHEGGSWYYATDYAGYNVGGNRVYRCPCYAPCDIKCIWVNTTECVAVWESLEKVHLANNTLDYLGLCVYHDNDVANGLITPGTIKRQGEQFNRTGTGGNVTGDHMHLETGHGKYSNPSVSTSRGTANYKYHFTDYTDVKRLHNYDALFINDTRIVTNRDAYKWKTFEGGVVPDEDDKKKKNKKKHYKFILFDRKRRGFI